MGMKRIYTCDICRDKIEDPRKSFGLNFTNLKDFTLGGYGCTEGTHICFNCINQLYKLLNNKEIQKHFIE